MYVITLKYMAHSCLLDKWKLTVKYYLRLSEDKTHVMCLEFIYQVGQWKYYS